MIQAVPAGLLLGVMTVSIPAAAHVQIDTPARDSVLTVGETVSVTWTDLVLHDPEGFDLDLLLEEEGDPIPIAHGLAIETHAYDWVLPDMPCVGCFLKVTQWNTINADYTDMIPISIVAGDPDASSTDASVGGAASTDDTVSTTTTAVSTADSNASAGGNETQDATESTGSATTTGSDMATASNGSSTTNTGSTSSPDPGVAGSDSGSEDDGGCSIAAANSVHRSSAPHYLGLGAWLVLLGVRRRR